MLANAIWKPIDLARDGDDISLARGQRISSKPPADISASREDVVVAYLVADERRTVGR